MKVSSFWVVRGLALGLGLCWLIGCQSGAAPRNDAALFHEVGGQPGIERLVERLIERVHEDPRIAELFADSDRADLHRLISEQFCAEFGGPCEYTGRSMEDAHSGLAITAAEFEAFVDDLLLAMDELGLGTTTQNRILRRLAPMRGQIIEQ